MICKHTLKKEEKTKINNNDHYNSTSDDNVIVIQIIYFYEIFTKCYYFNFPLPNKRNGKKQYIYTYTYKIYNTFSPIALAKFMASCAMVEKAECP